MRKKRIGLLFGMEDTFPWALIDAINRRGGDRVEASPVEISYLKDDGVFPYDLILDRISHEVPFYRTYLKCAAASGVKIVNNPIWWSADDKFFDNLVAKVCNVAVPRTVLLPHKQYPPNTEAKSFRNMQWVNWDEVFDYLKFPIFMKSNTSSQFTHCMLRNDFASVFGGYCLGGRSTVRGPPTLQTFAPRASKNLSSADHQIGLFTIFTPDAAAHLRYVR